MNLTPAPTPQKIEDAILFGHINELDDVLNGIDTDSGFPDELRHGLEALRWFRAWYGRNGEKPPATHLQKQKVAVLESAWSAELLDMLRHNQDLIRQTA